MLELGVNDIMRGISPAITLKNLQLIINKVKLKYPVVKLALMGMGNTRIYTRRFCSTVQGYI